MLTSTCEPSPRDHKSIIDNGAGELLEGGWGTAQRGTRGPIQFLCENFMY